MKLHMQDWLAEFDIPSSTSSLDPAGGQPPIGDPAHMPGGNAMDDPSASLIPGEQGGGEAPPEEDDVEQDPVAPDMPEADEPKDDFETWKKNFFKESIKGECTQLISLIQGVRDRDGLQPYQKKFLEDNLNVQLLRQNANIDKASREIRRLIKEQLDQHNPATTVVNHISTVLEQQPMLSDIFIKLSGYSNLKGDLHRKYIAALTGAVQVGSGANVEDIIFNEQEYSIMMSTRFNSLFGDVSLGTWSLKEDDPEKFLSEPELKRLQNGSPDEKEILRKRVIMEAIAQQFETRAFVVHVAGEEGTIYGLGWDVAGSLRAGYGEGKLIIKSDRVDSQEATIDEEGTIRPLMAINIYLVKETGEQDAGGNPEKHEEEFMSLKNGMLFLSASLDTIRNASSMLQGMALKEVPYRGNPSDLKVLQRCVYTAHDLLLKQCMM